MKKPSDVHAAELRARMEEPVFNPIIKKWVGRGEMEYERYIKTAELFALQLPEPQRISHDEMLFQVIHQSQELWLKLISHEMVKVVEQLDEDALWDASQSLERCARIARTLVGEMSVLETLTPDQYQTLRHHLGQGSGQESPGYNMIRVVGEGLEAAIDRLLERRGRPLREVYLGGETPDVKRICEQLVDLDEGFQNWLYAHYMLVRRTIGVNRSVKALDGIPTQVLAGRMSQPLFPKLWEARVDMSHEWKREEGSFLPGAERTRPPAAAKAVGGSAGDDPAGAATSGAKAAGSAAGPAPEPEPSA